MALMLVVVRSDNKQCNWVLTVGSDKQQKHLALDKYDGQFSLFSVNIELTNQ